MKKRNIALTALGVIVVLAVILGIKGMQLGAMAKMGENFQEPPMTVSATEVMEYSWQSRITTFGSLDAVKGVIITAEIPGRVSNILFSPGSEVKKGEILIEQDISTERTQLRAAQASANLSKTNVERLRELYKKGVVSKAELDRAEAEYKSAIANADNVKTTLTKKNITAPFDGQLGIRLINLGQEISAGDSIVSLQQVDPIFINFSVPQKNLPKLAAGQKVAVTNNALPEREFTGAITAINSQVDESTRSVRVQATLENPEKLLLPGMFASVEVELPEVRKVTVVPLTAIKYSSYGDSVFVLEPAEAEDDSKIEKLISRQQFVKLGKSRGDYIIVENGLEIGETIATDGVFKLRNKGPVIINNEVAPKFSFDPSPADQ